MSRTYGVALAAAAMLLSAGDGMAAARSKASSGKEAADLSISTAAISGGRLVIEGTAPKSGQVIKIDGRSNQTTADKTGAFAFDLAWTPPDCLVTLVAGGDTQDVLIADCAPVGATGAKGATGATGARGVQGVPGARGPAGPTGATGAAGAAGAAGATGAQGRAGESTIISLSGFAGDTSIQALPFQWQFISSGAGLGTVSNAYNKPILASATAVIGAAGSSVYYEYIICYRKTSTPGESPSSTNFYNPNYAVGGGATQTISISSVFYLPDSDSYDIGLCVFGSGPEYLNMPGKVNGWVQVLQ